MCFHACMGKIHQLAQNTIEQIAAGEVIERPASIIKELVENSLDAGAEHIVVEVEAGGKQSISVSDNGCGMDEADALLCLQRHATSKLKKSEDLWNLASFGFRGEALAAIAAVSDLTLETKLNEPTVFAGSKVLSRQGQVIEHGSFGCPGGTRVFAEKLFQYVPARLKFLKSDAVEYGHIADVITQAALSAPQVHFELWRDGKKALFFPKTSSLKERFISIIGEEWRERLLTLDASHELIQVSGVFGDLSTNFSTNKQLFVYVNKRPLKDRLLMSAVSLAYGEMLPKGRFPLAALFVEIAPQDVDVNVHPTKKEVRFASAQAVHDFVRRSLKEKLQAAAESSFFIPVSPTINPKPSFRHAESRSLELENAFFQTQAYQVQIQEPQISSAQKPQLTASLFAQLSQPERESFIPRVKALAQLSNSYVLAEGEKGELVVIDQHAAHERIGYNKLLKQYEDGKIEQQQLLLPELLQLSIKEVALLEENLPLFAELGFELQSFGELTYRVSAVPALLADNSVKELLERMLNEFETQGSMLSHEELLRKFFATLACHAQVRFGDRLSQAELQALINQIEAEKITHCPHGRPIQFTLSLAELEKRFQRT